MICWLAFEKKAISIMAGNLNSGRSYLNIAVTELVAQAVKYFMTDKMPRKTFL